MINNDNFIVKIIEVIIYYILSYICYIAIKQDFYFENFAYIYIYIIKN